MAETYCGKTCEDCTHKEQLNCPGCRMGPGRALHGDCSISKCSVSKGYHACEYCGSFDTCRNRRSSASAAEVRLNKQAADAAKKARIERNIKLLGSWLWVLFWLVIATSVVRVVFNDSLTAENPSIKTGVDIFNLVSGIAYSLILLRLAPVSDHYRYSGIAGFVCAGISFASTFITASGAALIVTLIASVFGFIREFQEYMGHGHATQEVDPDMTNKWCKLWYWYFGSLCAVCIGSVLAFMGSGLGVLAVLLGTATTAVASIIKIIYLYSTASLFKNYAEVIS